MPSSKIKTLLKDVIIVTHVDESGYQSNIIEIPDSVKNIPRTILVRALIHQIGTKFRFKDDLKIGDIVYVPMHFGNRIPKNSSSEPQYIMYDGEDVHAKVINES